MIAYNFNSVPSILVEDGAAGHIGALLKARFQVSRPLVITDMGLVKAGLVGPLMTAMKEAELAPALYDGVEADPSEAVVLEALKAAKAHESDLILGFGGGSSMDVAKLVAVQVQGGQALEDLYGLDRVESGRLPLVQMPTTAGTGSEVTQIAVITTGATRKMGVSDRTLLADLAILDATLTLGLPSHVTAATGIDAMVHAIEAYTSKIRKNPVSDGLARQALLMLGANIEAACKEGGNLEARRGMLVGAMLAGQAFANAPVAGVHALAYPLGGHYHLSHGLSNALVLPHVLRFNIPAAGGLYAELAALVGAGEGAEDFIAWLEKIADSVGIERRLRDVGVSNNDLRLLAEEAMLQERLLVNNPREMEQNDAFRIYEAAW